MFQSHFFNMFKFTMLGTQKFVSDTEVQFAGRQCLGRLQLLASYMYFYSPAALLAMQSAVIATPTAIPSVCHTLVPSE